MTRYPNGLPHPPEVYRRRRIAAVVIAVVVLLLLWWILSSVASALSSDNDSAAATSSSEKPTVTVTVTKSAEPGNDSDTKKGGDDTDADSTEKSKTPREPADELIPPGGTPDDADLAAAPSAGKDSCTVDDLAVRAATQKVDYPAGEAPELYLTVSNPTQAACHVDLATNPMKFEVYSLGQNERIWSDIDCGRPAAVGALDLKAGQSRTYRVAWNRTSSLPGNCQNPQAVLPGPYYVHTLIGNNHSDRHTFNLG